MPSTLRHLSPPAVPELTASEGINLTRELHLRRQELRALLEITEALNNETLSEEALYRTFGFTLLAQIGYSPVALFVPEIAVSVTLDATEPSEWRCRMSLPPKHRSGQGASPS